MAYRDTTTAVLWSLYAKQKPFNRATLLTQNKKLKKKRKYLIQGLTKENVSARFRFSFLSIVCWCFYSHVDLQWVLLQNSPQIQPHPADTQPPCESMRRGSFAGCGGVRLAKKGGMGLWRCPAVLVGPRTVHVGRRVRLHKKYLWLTAAEWPTSFGVLSACC